MNLLKKIFLTDRFFWGLAVVIAVFVLAFVVNWIFFTAQIMLALLLAFTLIDVFVLMNRKFALHAERDTAKVYSLGAENKVEIKIENRNSLKLSVMLVDELPHQLQKRNFRLQLQLKSHEEKILDYKICPKVRGAYEFGDINLFSESVIGLIRRKDVVEAVSKIAVYPSTVMMKRMELFAFKRFATQTGVRRIRRIGHSYEFDHIKSYVAGDDPRSINWNASGRRAELMVNHYMDEKAQQIYCLLDKSRVMEMPFNGLTLLDHSINASLVISNIALRKHDNAGLISFSNKIGNIVKAGNGKMQLHKIYNALYNEQENPLEANYELLYNAVRKLVGSRSLLMLFTNFESQYALERVLPLLRRINKFHLLVVVFFKNEQIHELSESESESVEDIYNQTIARKYLTEKELIMQELQKHRIQVIYTSPEKLPLNTVNKYLELKSRGMI